MIVRFFLIFLRLKPQPGEMTVCHEYGGFAYTRIFGKRSRIASNGLSHGFGHFLDEMRLNQVSAENQHVTGCVFCPKVSNGKQQMAK